MTVPSESDNAKEGEFGKRETYGLLLSSGRECKNGRFAPMAALSVPVKASATLVMVKRQSTPGQQGVECFPKSCTGRTEIREAAR